MEVVRKIHKILIIVIISSGFIQINSSCKKGNNENEPTFPVLTTTSVLGITQVNAVSGGTITSDGGTSVYSRGVCWGTNQNPTISESKTNDGTGNGTFSSTITGLTANTRYFVRAYATNSVGTSYGNQVSFTSSLIVPGTVTTSTISSITSSSAVSGGNITDDGGSTITAKGVCLSISLNPTISNIMTTDGSGIGSYVSYIKGLQPGTKYYIRTYATNSAGIAYGNELNFNTLDTASILTTTNISSITLNSAISGGTITSNGGTNIIARGICWSINPNPTIIDYHTIDGSGMGIFTSKLTDLLDNMTYYLRAYATNSFGIAYGNQVKFTTLSQTRNVTDVEGNIYSTVSIGTQLWMAENLKTTRYNDGSDIPLGYISTPGYCWYQHNESLYKNVYGALYNWFAVNTGKLCPTGWHVPTNTEWTTLTDYLGGEQVAGGELKESGTTHWEIPNVGATNESGFKALPGGLRREDGQFQYLNYQGFWWSITSHESLPTVSAWHLSLMFDSNGIRVSGYSKTQSLSVRCLRD